MVQKYFIAIVIPEPIQSLIMHEKHYVADNFASKGALRSPAHITLHMPFQWEEEKEEKLVSVLNKVNHQPFELELNNYNCFAPRVVFIDVIQNEALFSFQKLIVNTAKEKLNLFNQAEDMRGFHPHVTIAFRDLKKASFSLAYDYYKNKNFNQSFVCESYHLLKQKANIWESYKEFRF